ncbi:pilus assembly protein TadG-related protein [Kocuria oceani]|uniref:pilus assembly protein TadG-related protein n=1 Tax=Kocuria oceani TaxID=988827 RepID=UPI004036A5A1
MTVFTAVALVVLLGFAALAIDVGMLYQERAELQSGADAAALAIAQDCAVGRADCSTPTDTAQALAEANATDDAAAVIKASVDMVAQSVDVNLATGDESGVGSLSLAFAWVLGNESATVGASSGAQWGAVQKGPAQLSIAFAQCEVDAKFDDGLVVIGMQDNKNSAACPSGTTGSAGGFGWYKLAKNDNDPACGADVSVSVVVAADTGANLPSVCDEILARIKSGALDNILLFPVYQNVSDTGANAEYTITAWVAFEVLGWKFTSNEEYNYPTCTDSSVSCNKGIYGRFVEYVTLDDYELSMQPPSNGLAVVKLTD